LCIHGHFYQPPRENPWLEVIELQDSAYPYHDWNERITTECYAPNAVARLLDDQNQIVKLINNYSKISFNFGPTLLSWLTAKAPAVYRAILEADRESQQRFSGHGSALAQVYNHVIMPLANRRDRVTQIRWGIRDFERRFKRAPEGMWLAETAVDLETLELLADHGIRFTILAPHQAARLRMIGERHWTEINGAAIDPSRAYRQCLPSGTTIALFFYDAPIARAVAFEGLLSHGEQFIGKLLGSFAGERDWPQLMHIATDGESYGHHHRFGDMALAYTLEQIEAKQLARLTNYGEFLAKYPPTHEVEIVEKSSWSCAHGIDRWWSDCGCNSGGHPGWNQAWRTPLRDALDWLRDQVAPPWEKIARQLFKNPWAARDAYIDVILDRSAENIEKFFARHAARPLTASEQTSALKLLELQRHALLMYTSCGWFFDDLSGIETVQVIQFAARAVQLAEEHFHNFIEEQFVERLARAESNLAEHGNGREIYEKLVRPARIDWERVGAHYAVSSLFAGYPAQANIHCYRAEQKTFQIFEAGKAKLAVGRINLSSEITKESSDLVFGVLHMGDHHVNGGVRPFLGEEVEAYLAREIAEPFSRADFPEVIRLMDRRFGASNYSLRSLFRDERRQLVEWILAAALGETEILYRQIYQQRAPLMRFLKSIRIPLPKEFQSAAEFVVNKDLRRALEGEEINQERVKNLVQAAKLEGTALDTTTLEFAFRKNLDRLADQLGPTPSLAALQKLNNAVTLLPQLPFSANLWKIQNIYYQLSKSFYPTLRADCQAGEPSQAAALACFEELSKQLNVKIS
ncbi:MAG: glycoside hydrolase family 57, partial [Deltaproteobacteria bacterium]|nr:glycoside hydrolase family 57 [Deltaproteobacteria bacterium]